MSSSVLERETIAIEPGIRILPIVHGSLEYTIFVRKIFLESPPAALALELPENMSAALLKAVPHADSFPVLSLESKSNGMETHFIMEPLEPLVEGLRSAYEMGIPVHLVDAYNERYFSWVAEHFPDTFSVGVTGPAEMFRLYSKFRSGNQDVHLTPDESFLITQADFFREIHMAKQLRDLRSVRASGERDLLLICGIRHVDGIRRFLQMGEDEFASHMNLVRSDESFAGDDPDDEEEPLEALLSRDERLAREGENQGELVYKISTLSRDSTEVLEQPGYFNTVWLQVRDRVEILDHFNRVVLQRSAYRDAVSTYEKRTGDRIPLQREKLFFRFARNWSTLEGKLLPDLYKLVMSARGFGNDDFARIMFDTLSYLPGNSTSPFPERKLTLDDLYKNSRILRFRFKRKSKRPVPPPSIQKRYQREKYPGEWIESWRGDGICSYPPEDIRIEAFGTLLQEKASSLIKGKDSTTVEFTASLLDGIDYRETIRNLHLGKVFVKDEHPGGMQVGAVVIIFSDDDHLHSWKVVWWGEHHQESDMAFYASPPGETIVGPGIFQCRYGGLMLTLPPGRLHNIWEDDEYKVFESPSERLIMGALEYNNRNAIVHLAQRPPSARMHAIAGRMGQKIIHIPISTMDQITLNRIRRFHVLDSKERRDGADDFII